MQNYAFLYLFGAFIVGMVFFWTIGSIRRNTAKSAHSSAIAAGVVAREDDIKCPKCKEFIKVDAEVCRHCGFDGVQADVAVIAEVETRRNLQESRSGIQALESIDFLTRRSMRPFRIGMGATALLAFIASAMTTGGASVVFFYVSLVVLVAWLPIDMWLKKARHREAVTAVMGADE
jgi:hypothetical protein